MWCVSPFPKETIIQPNSNGQYCPVILLWRWSASMQTSRGQIVLKQKNISMLFWVHLLSSTLFMCIHCFDAVILTWIESILGHIGSPHLTAIIGIWISITKQCSHNIMTLWFSNDRSGNDLLPLLRDYHGWLSEGLMWLWFLTFCWLSPWLCGMPARKVTNCNPVTMGCCISWKSRLVSDCPECDHMITSVPKQLELLALVVSTTHSVPLKIQMITDRPLTEEHL